MNRAMRALLFLLAAWALGLAAPALAAGGSREAATLSAGWLFAKGDPAGAAEPAFDDTAWTRTTLPHTFNAGENGEGDSYRGPGWYRRAFEIAAIRPGRRLYVQFDGAALVADVHLNGSPVCRHEGGHAAFRCDLTGHLQPGRNVLAVRVDNSASRIVSPLGGDFTVFGGLYRPVSLIEADALHFDMLDHGGPGVYARASEIGESATVTVEARVANEQPRSRRAPVTVRVLDAEGREVARASASVQVPARGVRAASVNLRIAAPRLWDGVHDPYLYRVVARIGEAGDEVSVPLGIRSFAFDAERGFLLNGRSYPLRGVNLMHSARPGKGTAVTGAEIAEDFAIMREMGSTGVRLVHFQHPQAAYDEADRLGLAAWTEIGINGEIEDTPEFRANAAQQMRELIAQNYNHPSVVLWGIGNEVYADEPKVERVLRGLHDTAREADPSRPTVYAHCCQADDHPKAMVSDVIGFNRYFGWYPQDGTMDTWAAGFHAAHPERPFAVSEYGAGASVLHQQDPPPDWVEPGDGWHPEQYQARYHEQNWLALKDKPYVWGTFVWVGFDLASAGRHEGDRRGINDKGLVTYDRRVRKDAWYWYQAWWSDKPMLHITSRRFTQRPGAEVMVKVYTNAEAATLIVNGEEVGTRQAENRMVSWPVTLRPGANTIEVRAEVEGEVLTDAVNWQYREPPGMLSDPE